VHLFAIAASSAAAALALFAASASAATVAVQGESLVLYTAAPGEHNDLTVTGSLDGVTLDDAGAGVSVTAGRGCDQLGPHTARCYPHGDAPGVDVFAGDEDDTVRSIDSAGATVSLTASGEGGDDSLQASAGGSNLDGGPGADTLQGGAGIDHLIGGPGADTLSGGAGNDEFTPDGDGTAPAPDVVDGGPGVDGVSYDDRTTPVDVDLERVGGNGSPGENDTIRGIENVRSGSGSDHLRGDSQPNLLASSPLSSGTAPEHDVVDGRGGDDQIEGSEGDDVLTGGAGGDSIDSNGGADSLSGGPGDDGIDLTDAAPRSLRCGPGDDLVNYPRVREPIHPECETVQVDALYLLVGTRLGRVPGGTGGVRTVEVSWFPGFTNLPCRVVARLSRPGSGAPLGRGSALLRPATRYTTTLRLHLSAVGRRVLASRKRVPLRLSLDGHASCNRNARNDGWGAGAFTFLSP
jgi:Ca2+-binding RTX toxin-like protein